MKTIEVEHKAKQTLLAIGFFLFIYLLLITLSFALTIGFAFAGIGVVAMSPSFFTLFLGIGLASIGGLVFFFLIKFIFKRVKVDRSDMIEVNENEEPRLFALIRQLTREVGTDFPKKVYLTRDVNAAVFYDSSFWSMFFPTKKNLQIGLGLVNAVTETELKAILAHEFGHFSQKTLKVGSYVYNVNSVIYNMLYDNSSYSNLLQRWSSFSWIFAICAWIGITIITGIQWILQKMYGIVNVRYMELSREMEFEADQIAASVVGSKPLIDSLLRIQLANDALQYLMNFYQEQVAKEEVAENIYPQHHYLMTYLAKESNLNIENNLPVVTVESLNKFDRSKIVIENQWQSHPSTADRVQHLTDLGFDAEPSLDTAWSIFENAQKWQDKFTKEIFADVKFSQTPKRLSLENFKEEYSAYKQKYSFDKRYNDFYNSKEISEFNMERIIDRINSKSSKITITETTELEEIFNEKNTEFILKQQGLESDCLILEAIITKQIKLKTFDYEGIKYPVKHAPLILEELQDEAQKNKEFILQNEENAFVYFYKKAQANNKDTVLQKLYINYFEKYQLQKSDELIHKTLLEKSQFIGQQLEIHEIEEYMAQLEFEERKMRSRLKEITENEPHLLEIYTSENKKQLEDYLSQEWVYFDHDHYYETPLGLLFSAYNYYHELSNQSLFLNKKHLLERQLELAA